MNNEALLTLSAAEAVAAMVRGEVTAETYATALLRRCEAAESLNAFITLDPEWVIKAAQQHDRQRRAGHALGPLHGLPIPVKGSINEGKTRFVFLCPLRSTGQLHARFEWNESRYSWQQSSGRVLILLKNTSLEGINFRIVSSGPKADFGRFASGKRRRPNLSVLKTPFIEVTPKGVTSCLLLTPAPWLEPDGGRQSREAINLKGQSHYSAGRA